MFLHDYLEECHPLNLNRYLALVEMKDIPSLWIGRLLIVPVSTLSKEINKCSVVLIKIPRAFCAEMEKNLT